MTDPDPIQEMIDQLNQMVRLVQERKMDISSEPLPPGIDEVLDDLENQVAIFRKVTQETLEELGLSREEIAKRLHNPPKQMPVKDKQKIRQLNYLRKDADEIRWMLGLAAKKAERTLANPPTKKLTAEEKRAKKHKKRYKRLGGDEKWKAI